MRHSLKIAAAVLVLWADVSSAQTVDEVIDKSLAALGGRAAHAKINSRVATGDITLTTPVGDIKGTIDIMNARPNKLRTVIKADLSALGVGQLAVDQRFDGKAGYAMDSLQGNRDITGNQLDNMRNSAFPNPMIEYKERGTSAKLTGKDKVGDREAFVIEFEPVTGSAIRQYIDAETYLPLRAVIKTDVPQLGQTVEQTSDFSDYRELDGIKVPFELRSTSSVQNFTVKLTKVEHNTKIDESLFSKPAQ
jgi:outer membrane lipoprotein-sorting protein